MTTKRIFRYVLIFFVLLALIGFAMRHHPVATAWYWAQMQWHKTQHERDNLYLGDYQAVVKAHAVEGVDDNLSGITWNPDRQTLFVVVNKPAELIELDTDGHRLNRMPLAFAHDVEDIAYLGQGRFALIGERENRLYIVALNADGNGLVSEQDLQLPLAPRDPNHGAEALTWQARTDTLIIGQEKNPIRIVDLPLAAIPKVGQTVPEDVAKMYTNWSPRGWHALFINDLSAITIDPTTSNRLLLSDNSALVVEYDADDRPVSMLPLWRGMHGLRKTIPQAEGIALGDDRRLFIVSEPNLFYRFEKRL